MGDTITVENCIAHGPWGGDQGEDWVFMAQGFIKRINISYGEAINGIEFQSSCSKDATQKSFFGSKSGNRTDTICLDYPNEYITSIRGWIGFLNGYGSSSVVTSLCFGTNQNRYGPYGSDGMSGSDHKNRNILYKPFSYDGKRGMIVGFHGRADKYVDAIGIYVMPKSLALDRHSTREEHSKKCCSISRMVMQREAGPWGPSGGKPWDDGVFSGVKQVRLHIGQKSQVIYAIQIEYVKKNGKSISPPSHGDTDGDIINEVKLDWTNEYMTGISGFYGPVKGSYGLVGINSLTFHTNKKRYGPYGQKSGSGFIYFTSTSSPGKVVGFHGRNIGFLSAIGVHMEYF